MSKVIVLDEYFYRDILEMNSLQNNEGNWQKNCKNSLVIIWEEFDKRNYKASLKEYESLEKTKLSNIPPTLLNNQDFSRKFKDPVFFCAHLTLGDIYTKLGRFENALEKYFKAFLILSTNHPIIIAFNGHVSNPDLFFATTIWMKIANCCLQWGDFSFRKGNYEKAKLIYNNIIHGDGITFSDIQTIDLDLNHYIIPLYNLLNLSSLRIKILQLLEKRDTFIPSEANETEIQMDLEDDSLGEYNPLILNIIFQYLQRHNNIDNNLNYFSLPADYVPIQRFESLQIVASSFASFASKLGREYIEYKNRVSTSEISEISFLESLDLSNKALEIDISNIDIVNKEIDTIENSYSSLQKNIKMLNNYRENYILSSELINNFDNNLAWTQAAGSEVDINIEQRRLSRNDIKSKDPKYDDYLEAKARKYFDGVGYLWKDSVKILFKHLVPKEEMILGYTGDRNREVLKRNLLQLDLEEKKLLLNKDNLNYQMRTAISRKKSARLKVKAAKAKIEYDKRKLEIIKGQEIDFRFYYKLSEEIKELAEIYLSRAFEIAYMMQRAYNFEYSVDFNIIKNPYSVSQYSDKIIAADYLLTDIDFFTHHKLTQTREKTHYIFKEFNLELQYPLEFNEFKRTGVLFFSTFLDDFFLEFPGFYNLRIMNVNLTSESTRKHTLKLTSGGISKVRTLNQNEMLNKFEILITKTNENDQTIFEPKLLEAPQNSQIIFFNTDSLELTIKSGNVDIGSSNIKTQKIKPGLKSIPIQLLNFNIGTEITYSCIEKPDMQGKIKVTDPKTHRSRIINLHHPSETLIVGPAVSERGISDTMLTILKQERNYRELRIFEGMGVETDWFIEFSSLINKGSVSNISSLKLELVFSCQYDRLLYEEDTKFIVEKEYEKKYIHKMEPLDEDFSQLEKDGVINIQITKEDIGLNKSKPSIKKITFKMFDKKHNAIKIVINLSRRDYLVLDETEEIDWGESVKLESNEQNIISIESGSNSSASHFIGKNLVSEWKLSIKAEENNNLIPSNETNNKLNLKDIELMVFDIEYKFNYTKDIDNGGF